MLYALLFYVDEKLAIRIQKKTIINLVKNFYFGALTLVCILCLCVFFFPMFHMETTLFKPNLLRIKFVYAHLSSLIFIISVFALSATLLSFEWPKGK